MMFLVGLLLALVIPTTEKMTFHNMEFSYASTLQLEEDEAVDSISFTNFGPSREGVIPPGGIVITISVEEGYNLQKSISEDSQGSTVYPGKSMKVQDHPAKRVMLVKDVGSHRYVTTSIYVSVDGVTYKFSEITDYGDPSWLLKQKVLDDLVGSVHFLKE